MKIGGRAVTHGNSWDDWIRVGSRDWGCGIRLRGRDRRWSHSWAIVNTSKTKSTNAFEGVLKFSKTFGSAVDLERDRKQISLAREESELNGGKGEQSKWSDFRF